MPLHVNIDVKQLVEWMFMSIISLGIHASARFLAAMNKNIVELNTKMAVVVEQVGQHSKRIDHLETRVDKQEIANS